MAVDFDGDMNETKQIKKVKWKEEKSWESDYIGSSKIAKAKVLSLVTHLDRAVWIQPSNDLWYWFSLQSQFDPSKTNFD
jgi:hypothetical protein